MIDIRVTHPLDKNDQLVKAIIEVCEQHGAILMASVKNYTVEGNISVSPYRVDEVLTVKVGD